jgi:Family of unknown function (DUF6349)
MRRRTADDPDQLTLWDDPPPPPAPETLPSPCLFSSPARGLTARLAEFQAWRDQYGNFGRFGRSHGWHVAHQGDFAPAPPGRRCQPAVMEADLRAAPGPRDVPCDCTETVGALLYLAACRGCEWEGQPRTTWNAAVEDGCDHAWPGWRELPILATSFPDMAGDGTAGRRVKAKWADGVTGVYPQGWLEAGGPVRTHRPAGGTRHVPGRTPFGGFDLGTTEAATKASAARQGAAALLGRAERRAAVRESAHVPIDYAAAKAEHTRHMRALTVAINSGDPDKVVLACAAAVADWDKPGRAWPDNWNRWQIALDDSQPWNRPVLLEDLRGGPAPLAG